ASGYGGITQRLFNAGFSGRRVRRDFALTPEATIRGRVVRGSDGSPVVGAAVRTAAGDIGPRLPADGAAVTDENGRFSVGGLAPGRHRVVAFAAGLATSDPVDVNAEAGHGTPEIVLRLQAASSIRGVVVDGSDPVAGATVSVPRFGEIPGGDAVTQSDGSFVLDAVPRGVVTLRVAPYEVKTPKTIVVDRPQLDGVRIVVEAMGSIAGRVTRFGKPYTGIGVFCPGRADPVFADGDGNYVLRGLRPGKYQIVAQDGRVGGFAEPAVISLDRDEHRTGADIDLQYAGSIAGVVVEESGTPVGGVLVHYSAVHKEDLGEDTTAPDGTFVVGTLVGGDDYQPTVRANMNSATRLVPVADSFAAVTVADGAANVTGVRLVVKRDHLSIAGTTVGGDGQPIGDVHVTAFRVDSDETPSFNRWFDHPSAISAVDGHFSIDDLDAGRFVLEARGGDGSEATAKNIAAGQKNVVITLQSSGAIDGLLVGFTTPPSEVAAKLDNPMSPSLRSLATIDGDSFHFRGLAAGSYLVAATGGGAGDSQIVQVQAGQTATVTLHNHGSSSVHGHVSEWRGGAAVVGMRCQAMVDSPSGTLMWGNANPSFSDNSGDFTLDGVAAGSNRIICDGGMPFYSNGIAHVTVVDGQPATVSIPVVKRREGGVVGDIGAVIASDSALVARIATLEPQGAFARAGLKTGDIVVSVDGTSVAKLAPMGIDFAIGDRPLGSHAAVGVTRVGKEVVADVAITTPEQF
ncbi:MAG: hypothetical protein JWM53_2157, partial [bacterium]|nr:hypothetical protein [bacterium]